DHQRLRSGDSEPGASFRNVGELAGTGKNFDAARGQHGPTHLRVLGVAMAGCGLRRLRHPCKAQVDVWTEWSAQEQSVSGSGADALAACGIHAGVANADTLPKAG